MSSRGEEFADRLREVREEIASYQPNLIVVTKTYPVEDAIALRALDVEDFGENRTEEGSVKAPAVGGRWHFQGQIQSKKIRSILSWADQIHSIDDLGHARKIDEVLAQESDRVGAFIQLSLDGDPSRGGVLRSDLSNFAQAIREMTHIDLQGLMCVPPVDMDPVLAFTEIADIHRAFISEFPESKYLSAGMSGDYLIALDHGATHIRLGSKILGARTYPQ